MKSRDNIGEEINRMLDGIHKDERALRMKEFIQHGKISTYEHCLRVAVMSYRLNRFFRLRADERVLVRGAFLHDYFLYDWHDKSVKIGSLREFFKLHGFTHPDNAADNARRDFEIGEGEEHVIRSHMWPLTFRKPPRSKEAIIVCIADKLTSVTETILRF